MFSNKKDQPKTEATTKPATRKNASGIPSIISVDMTINGNIVSEGVVDIDGTVEGNVRCQSATIRKHGVIKGDVVAESVHVYGTVRGLIKAKTAQFFRGCRVEGVIMHESIAIEDGAFVDGRFKRVEKVDLESDDTPTASASHQFEQELEGVHSTTTPIWDDSFEDDDLKPSPKLESDDKSSEKDAVTDSKKAPSFLMSSAEKKADDEKDTKPTFPMSDDASGETSEKNGDAEADKKAKSAKKSDQKVRVLDNLRLISDAS